MDENHQQRQRLVCVFIPSAILIILAIVWLLTGHPMQTNYTSASNCETDLGHWDTIVFLSSMMFAFAGLEVAPMIAGRTRNPQRDFRGRWLFLPPSLSGYIWLVPGH